MSHRVTATGADRTPLQTLTSWMENTVKSQDEVIRWMRDTDDLGDDSKHLAELLDDIQAGANRIETAAGRLLERAQRKAMERAGAEAAIRGGNGIGG